MANVKLNIITATNMQGLIQLENKLKDIKQIAQSADNSMVGTYSAVEIQKTVNAVNTLQHALRAAYDTKLNTVNIEKFNQYLAKSKMSVQDLYINLSRMGATGRQVFMDMTQTTLMMGRSVKQTSKFVEEMQTTMMNTVKWGISSGLWNTMLSSVSKAWGYVKGLNSDLTDIRIVTGKSADQMERFAKTANKAAKDLGVATRDYTQGALLYYQQGDDDETVKTKTDITAKASNITGQDMSTVSEQLTAVWNGYQVANQAAEEGMQVYEEYVDKLSAVAATTASDLEEQATAMSKVASAAYSMGVNFDDLNAQIATIVSVTRQAPESVGTALKTIYARLGDLKVDGVDEFGTKLGEVSGQLQTMGIEVLDSNGNMRDMSTVMTEVAEKWDTWTSAQKQAAAVAMAGKRQYNNLIALFDNWDMYGESLETSMEATGTLSEQQGIAMDSLEKKMQRMTTASERMYNALFNEESMGGMIDSLTSIIDKVASLTETVGGLGNILPMVGGMLLKSFGDGIGNSIANKVINNRVRERELSNDDAKLQLAAQLGDRGKFLTNDATESDLLLVKQQEDIANNYKEMMKYRKNMTDEEIEAYNLAVKNRVEVANTKIEIQDTVDILKEKKTLQEAEYNIINKLNRGENLTETEQKELDILKEKVKKQQELYELSKEETITENLKPISVGVEISRDRKMPSLKDFKNKSENAVEGIVKGAYGANADEGKLKNDIDSINKALEQARQNGLNVEEAISIVKKELNESDEGIKFGDSIFNDIRRVYQDIKEETEKFETHVGKVFDENIGGALKENLGEDSEEIIENLRKRIITLVKEGKTFEKAYETALEEIGQEAKDVQEVLQDIDISNIDMENAEFEMKDLLDTQSLKEDIEGVTNVVGGFIQAWGGLGSVFNTVKEASDPALSGFERLKTILQGVTIAIPMVVSGIASVATGLNGLVSLMGKKSIADATQMVLSKGNLILLKLINSENIIGKAITATLLKLKKVEISEEERALIVKKLSEGQTWKQATANTALAGSMAPILIALAAMAAAFVALIAVMGIVASVEAKKKKAYEESAEAAQRNLEAHHKLTDAAIEHNNVIKNIISTYDDLTEQYKNNEISLHELRSQISNTLTEYGLYDEAIKALISDYDELDKSMEEAKRNSLNEVIDTSKKELSLTEKSAKASLENYIAQEYGSGTMETGGWIDIDFNGLSGHQSSAMDMYKILKNDYNVRTAEGEKIKSSDLAALAGSDQYYDVIKDLTNINGGEEVRMIISALEQAHEIYEESEGTQNELATAVKDLTILNANTDNISSMSSYMEMINKLAEETSEQAFNGDINKARQWAAAQLQDKIGSEGNRFTKEYTIIANIADKEGKDINEVLKETQSVLNSMSESELDVLIDMDWSSSKIGKTDFSNLTEFEKAKEEINAVESLIAKKEELTDVELDSLFSNEEFKKFINMSKEEFDLLNFTYQKQLMTDFYDEAIKQADKYKNEAVKDAYELANETHEIEKQRALENYDKNLNIENISKNVDYSDDILNSLTDITYWEGDYSQYVTSEDIEQLLKQTTDLIMQNKSLTFDDAVRILQEQYNDSNSKENKILSHQYFSNYSSGVEKFLEEREKFEKEFDKKAEAAVSKAANVEGYKRNYTIEVQNKMSGFQEGITDIQNFANEFQSLNGIISDYNKNGGYTVDNLMTLTSLSAEMLSVIEFENGALKINEENLKKITLAKIDDSIASALNAAQTRLQALAEGDLNAAQIEGIKTTAIYTYTINNLSEALDGGEEKLKSYIETLAGLTGPQSSEYNKYANQIVKDTEASLIPLVDLRKQIANSDFSLFGGDASGKDEELKFLEDEFDRYWDLNNAIDVTSKALEDLSETQDKLTRGELQDSLREQNELLEQQIVNYQNLRKEQEKEAGELKGKLLTFGVDFNADGSIANYAEVTQEALDYYNNLIERRKSGKITDSQLETGEKSYEKFKETLERYDSLYYDEMIETAENIADTQREILENNLQDFELSITIKTDAAEFDREVKDFETEIAKDFTKAFEDIDSVIEKSQFDVESYGESFNAVAAGISKVEEEILKLHNGENSDMFSSITEAQEKLKELNKEAMEHASNMKAAYEEAWEAYLEGIDQSQEKFDDLQEKYSKINEELEYQKELIELIYGPKAYDLMDKFYEKQKENSLSQIKSLQYEKEMWLSIYDAKAAENGDEDQLKIAERISQIQSDLNSNVTSYIQLLKDEYANTINGILSNFESQLTNGSSLDDIAEEWERLTENSDKYFNNVEGLYETQTLANKIKDSINDTISVKNQEKLQALYDREIEYLREKENLTQYDLDAAEARYQIALKEIALEEARENKNAMKLMRDTNGNWSYQYVADEDNIAEKQQELSDAMYKFYELSDKAYQENLESIQKLNQEYFDKAEEIATNELLTEQEKELKLEELRKWYLNQYQLLVSENEIIRQNLANGTVGVLNNLYNQDATNFENMTLQEQAALTQVKELGIASFAELEDKARQNIEGIGNSINIVAEQNIPEMTSKTQELADTWGADDGASVKAQSLDALNSMIETSEQYQITSSEVAAAVKEDWGENGIAGAISNAAQYVIDLEEATKNLCNDTKTNLATYKDNVDKISTSWENVKTAIEDSIKELNKLYELQGNPPPKVDVPDGTKEEGDGGGLIKIPDSVGGGGGGGTPDKEPPDTAAPTKYRIIYSDIKMHNPYAITATTWNTVFSGFKDRNGMRAVTVTHPDPTKGKFEGYAKENTTYNSIEEARKIVNGKKNLKDYEANRYRSFDTGGYTGEWGSDGRMAILHEKELVLNKEDTSNILAAVNGIRQFSSIESAISKGIASMIMNMTGMGVNVNYNTNEAKENQTKQVFNIQAEFPNANNVSEIREAILSLPGLASQQVGLNLI